MRHLKEQISLAQERIQQDHAQDAQISHEPFPIPSEDLQPASEPTSLLDDILPVTATNSDEWETLDTTPPEQIPELTPVPNSETSNLADEQEEKKVPNSTYSAEKLAQTVDDIKYAALTYKERGKKDEYEKKLIEWISLIGDHEEFLTMLADHYFEEGHYVKAGTLLKKIIHLNPENHRAIWQLWQIYAHDKDIETAKLLLEKARDLKDDNPKYLISLVEIYYEERNIKECITLVEKLSKLRPTNADYLLTLGNLHEELNQPTKAHSYYMKVLELNPLNDEAKQAIKRLL